MAAQDAHPTETIKTFGPYMHNGRPGWLTSNGLLTADGIDPDVKGELPDLKDKPIEIPWVDLDDPDTAARVLEAIHEMYAIKGLLAIAGLWELLVGAVVTTAAGVQPGAVALFGDGGLGKTALMRMINGMYGPEWMDGPALALNGSA